MYSWLSRCSIARGLSTGLSLVAVGPTKLKPLSCFLAVLHKECVCVSIPCFYLIFPLGKIRFFALQYLLTLLWGTYVKM